MSLPLIINGNKDFAKKISYPTDIKAIIATSLHQGAQIILDPVNQIKAIYLNPNDASFSALKLIEIALLHRPATPVFLIDSENELSHEDQKRFFEQFQVRGFFSGQESLPEILEKSSNINNFITPEFSSRENKLSHYPGYIAVPILDFLHTAHYNFDIFIEGENQRLSLFATEGSPVDIEYLSHAIEKSRWFYINEECIKAIHEKIKKTKAEMSESTSFPISWKTAETLYKAKTLLNGIHHNALSDSIVNNTHEILGDLFHLVSQLQSNQNSEKLSRFIEQSHDCDRNIACVTLSILMCKALKFEKNAIVEILGLASLFQDISLMNSPFENLKKTDAYYLKHPIMSAELLAQATSIPEVTLQVIRQHHERKDRTGFPGKIGGMQLHPMAEILSLINAFIDDQPQSLSEENEIYRHYSDRIVVAFKQIQFKVKKETPSICTKSREAA